MQLIRGWVGDRYGDVPVMGVSALEPEARNIDRISTLVGVMKDMV